MGSQPRRVRAYVASALGALVALVVGGGGLFVLCDPGPAYWGTIAAILCGTAAVCVWAALTARPRRWGVWAAPALIGGFVALLAVVALSNLAAPRADATAAFTQSCREEPSIGPAPAP